MADEQVHYSPPVSNNTFGGMRTNPEEDEEEFYSCSTPNKRSSVLAKVKERAKKLKSSLSIKRKQANHHPNNDAAAGALSSGIDLDDDEPGEEDPEYLGAPIYESEAAPESLREHARQHPRAVPVVSENRRVPSNIKKTEAHIETDLEEKKEPNRTDSEKLIIPAAYAAAVSDDATTETLTSKIANLTVSTTAKKTEDDAKPEATEQEPIEGETEINKTSPAEPNQSRTVSVKEFLMNKLEPGDDERALSQAITAAITPNSGSSIGDSAVVKKMRGAVTSLFSNTSNDDARKKGPFLDSAKSHSAKHYQPPATNPAVSRSLTATAHQVPEEEKTHGKILQTN